MRDPDRFTEHDRAAVLEALAIEIKKKHDGVPHSEAVILACELCLKYHARKPSAEPPHYTMPPDAPPQPRFWWHDKD